MLKFGKPINKKLFTIMIRCNHCGQMVDDTATYCPKCGQPVNAQTPPNFNQQQQQQQQGFYTAPNGRKVRNMEMLEACKLFWVKYATFEGRSRRAEFWWAYLMTFVLSLLLSWTYIVPLACLIPSIAVGVRRLHDIGKSGWYYLLSLIPIVGTIVLIVWWCQEGTIGRNEYGEDPKYIA